MDLAALLFPVVSLCSNHLSACSPSRFDSAALNETSRLRSLHLSAVTKEESGQWEQAAAIYRDELRLLDRMGRPGKMISAQVYISLAGLYHIEGHLDDAEAAYRKSIAVMQKYPSSGVELARAWEGLYWLYTEWGRLADAGDALNKGLQIAGKVSPELSAQKIGLLDSQAVLLCANGRYAEAERTWQRALKIGQEDSPANEKPYRAVLTHLGQMYSRIGEYTLAGDFLQRSLAAHADPQDSASISQAVLRSELAFVYMHTKRIAEADALFAQAMKVAGLVGPGVPIATSLIFSRFGDYRMIQHRWQDAENCYRRALSLRADVLGDHKMVAESFFDLSRALDKLHRKAEAKNCRERASQIMAAQKTPDTTAQTVDVLSFRARN